MVVLNSLEEVQDLLEKRSVKYSDRPKMNMLLGLYVQKPILPYKGRVNRVVALILALSGWALTTALA